MVKFLLTLILIYFIYKIVKAGRQLKREKSGSYNSNPATGAGEDLVEDPVCHTYVPVSQAYKKEIFGKTCYFCSQQCSEKYAAEKNN